MPRAHSCSVSVICAAGCVSLRSNIVKLLRVKAVKLLAVSRNNKNFNSV